MKSIHVLIQSILTYGWMEVNIIQVSGPSALAVFVTDALSIVKCSNPLQTSSEFRVYKWQWFFCNRLPYFFHSLKHFHFLFVFHFVLDLYFSAMFLCTLASDVNVLTDKLSCRCRKMAIWGGSISEFIQPHKYRHASVSEMSRWRVSE